MNCAFLTYFNKKYNINVQILKQYAVSVLLFVLPSVNIKMSKYLNFVQIFLQFCQRGGNFLKKATAAR